MVIFQIILMAIYTLLGFAIASVACFVTLLLFSSTAYVLRL